MLKFEKNDLDEKYKMIYRLEESITKTDEIRKELEKDYYFNFIKGLIEFHYDLGTVTEVYEIFGGTVNRNFAARIEKDGDSKLWFVRQYVHNKEVEEILYEHGLLKHIRKNGFTINSEPAEAKNGKTFIIANQGVGDDSVQYYYAVSEFLGGDDTYNWERNNVSPKACASAARTVALFHKAAHSFNPPEDWGCNEPVIKEQLAYYASNIEKYTEGLKRNSGNELYTEYLESKHDYFHEVTNRLSRIFVDNDELVQTVIHSDLHPGNFKYDDGVVVGLFDFDWPKKDVRLYEVAIAAHFFSSSWETSGNGSHDLSLVKLFIENYNSEMSSNDGGPGPLNDTEIKYFPEMMMIGSMYVVHFCSGQCFRNDKLNIFEYFYYTQHEVRSVEWIDAHLDEVRGICRAASCLKDAALSTAKG